MEFIITKNEQEKAENDIKNGKYRIYADNGNTTFLTVEDAIAYGLRNHCEIFFDNFFKLKFYLCKKHYCDKYDFLFLPQDPNRSSGYSYYYTGWSLVKSTKKSLYRLIIQGCTEWTNLSNYSGILFEEDLKKYY